MFARHLLSVAVLPFSVAVLVWDPPRRLVVRGPYRYVRNPMISGVVFTLFSEALLLVSRPHLMWALIFLGANFVWIPLVEEAGLRHRFGDSYAQYCRHVPRLIPRLHPWEPEHGSGMGGRSSGLEFHR
jgi:protein-S-isoprenylcysteine O-methyltransferase Ste14